LLRETRQRQLQAQPDDEEYSFHLFACELFARTRS
jgi:hypothetical protein